jgi:hypothetical protein
MKASKNLGKITSFFKPKEGAVVSESKAEPHTQISSQFVKSPVEEVKDMKFDTDYEFDKEEFIKNYNDGKRIYQNNLRFYECHRMDMIRFVDLLSENLNLEELKENECGKKPESIVMTTFVAEDAYIAKTITKMGIE